MADPNDPAQDETPLDPSPSSASDPAQPSTPPAKPATQAIPEGYVPSHRLREVTERSRTAESEYNRRVAQYEAQLDAERRKVQALTGVTPTSPRDAEIAEARKTLEQMYPGLARLSDKKFLERLDQISEQVPALQANNEQYWTTQGTRAYRELETLATKELGTTNLSDRGKSALQSAFKNWIETDEQAASRYIQNDPTVVTDFWAEYKAAFIDPVRRTHGASLIARNERLRQPRGGPSAGPNAPAPKKPDFTNEDSVHDAAWDAISRSL